MPHYDDKKAKASLLGFAQQRTLQINPVLVDAELDALFTQFEGLARSVGLTVTPSKTIPGMLVHGGGSKGVVVSKNPENLGFNLDSPVPTNAPPDNVSFAWDPFDKKFETENRPQPLWELTEAVIHRLK